MEEVVGEKKKKNWNVLEEVVGRKGDERKRKLECSGGSGREKRGKKEKRKENGRVHV